jgi:hypothetical protein
VIWLDKVIQYLTEKRKISVSKLMIAKYALLNKLAARIADARKKAREKSFELFQRESRKKLILVILLISLPICMTAYLYIRVHTNSKIIF